MIADAMTEARSLAARGFVDGRVNCVSLQPAQQGANDP
jgi:hypothetical protein